MSDNYFNTLPLRLQLERLERAVQSGRISEARIDESYQRVLALKRKAGLIQ